jgi:hypothetical protein
MICDKASICPFDKMEQKTAAKKKERRNLLHDVQG